MKQPLFVINFKAYKEAIGKNALKLAKICERISKKTKKTVIVCPQLADIEIAKKLKIPVFSQHIDPINYGKFTGFVLPESVKEAGASGTLLNHSEHRLSFEMLERCIKRAREIKLISIACADTPENAYEIAKMNPDYIAIEPPELIGGNISVSKAKPEIITKTIDAVKKAKNIPVLCGAGIHTNDDVRTALKLGSEGILVASGFVLAKNPEKMLMELMREVKS